MKTALLLSLLFSLCLAAPAPVRVAFSSITKTAYLQAKKNRMETKPSILFPLRKQQGRIIIPTAKGNKVYQDRGVGTDADDQAQFEYRGFLPQFGCHLIVAHYW